MFSYALSAVFIKNHPEAEHMSNQNVKKGAAIKISAALIVLAVTVILCFSRGSFTALTCRGLPQPADTADAFFSALCEGDYKQCDTYIGNYSTLGMTSATDTPVAERMFELLEDSYSYRLLENDYDAASLADILSCSDVASHSDIMAGFIPNSIDGKQATQAVVFTHLDIGSMTNDLHELATEIAYDYAFQSIDINNEETATKAVLEAIDILSKDIEKYYRSELFIVQMNYDSGEWKISLDEDLYKAIIGNVA